MFQLFLKWLIRTPSDYILKSNFSVLFNFIVCILLQIAILY